jgi:hypothetical protein
MRRAVSLVAARSPHAGAPHRRSRNTRRLPAGVADNEALRKLVGAAARRVSIGSVGLTPAVARARTSR